MNRDAVPDTLPLSRRRLVAGSAGAVAAGGA